MFIEFLQIYLPLVVYVLLIVILVVGIIIGCKTIKTLNKLESIVDDVSKKVSSLNGVFSIIDLTTDKIVAITDRVVETASNLIGKVFKRNKTKKISKTEE